MIEYRPIPPCGTCHACVSLALARAAVDEINAFVLPHIARAQQLSWYASRATSHRARVNESTWYELRDAFVADVLESFGVRDAICERFGFVIVEVKP